MDEDGAAGPAGNSRRHVFMNAIPVTGLLHVMDNLSHSAHTVLHDWPNFETHLRALSNVFRRADCRQRFVDCCLGGVDPQRLFSVKAPSLDCCLGSQWAGLPTEEWTLLLVEVTCHVQGKDWARVVKACGWGGGAGGGEVGGGTEHGGGIGRLALASVIYLRCSLVRPPSQLVRVVLRCFPSWPTPCSANSYFLKHRACAFGVLGCSHPHVAG